MIKRDIYPYDVCWWMAHWEENLRTTLERDYNIALKVLEEGGDRRSMVLSDDARRAFCEGMLKVNNRIPDSIVYYPEGGECFQLKIGGD